jgi:hypothetical protein
MASITSRVSSRTRSRTGPSPSSALRLYFASVLAVGTTPHIIFSLQNWIKESIAFHTTQGTILLSDLIAGKGFKQFIVLSTVSLVTSSLELKENTVPETFFFDAHHFGFARERIERIVDATTVFVTASQNIGAPSPEKRLVSYFVCVWVQFIFL